VRIEDVYISVKQRVESNLTNGGITLDKARFVNLFNESQLKFVDDTLNHKNDDTIRDIDILLVRDKRAVRTGKVLNKVSFRSPDDLYSFVNVRCTASNGGCSSGDFLLWEAKHENVHELLGDENNKPSWKYRESFYTVGGNQISVYTGDFDIDSLYVTYYRNPVRIDIAGIMRESGISSSIDTEWPDRIIVRIMDIMVKEFDKNEFNTDRYNVDKQEVYTLK